MDAKLIDRYLLAKAKHQLHDEQAKQSKAELDEIGMEISLQMQEDDLQNVKLSDNRGTLLLRRKKQYNAIDQQELREVLKSVGAEFICTPQNGKLNAYI